MRGFGTIVTGTLMSGKIKVGDNVDIMPEGLKAKIRGIQIHGKAEESASAGQRTAINLQGIDKEVLDRGDVLTTPDTFEPSFRMDILLNYLTTSSKKLKNRAPVRFHKADRRDSDAPLQEAERIEGNIDRRAGTS